MFKETKGMSYQEYVNYFNTDEGKRHNKWLVYISLKEMYLSNLKAAKAMSMMKTKHNSEQVRMFIENSLRTAERLKEKYQTYQKMLNDR